MHVAIEELNALTPAELIILEEHLKLGADHLKKHLDGKEMQALLRLGKINKEPLQKMRQGAAEIAGKLTLLLNTIFTATFGAWLGLTGFWGLSLGSTAVVGSVCVLAAGIGAFIGYQNYRHAKIQESAAIRNQQINSLQIEILDKIYEKRNKEERDIKKELNRLIFSLAKNVNLEKNKTKDLVNCDFSSEEEVLEWVARLDRVVQEKLAACQEHKVYEIYSKKLAALQSKLEKNLKECCQEREEAEAIHSGPSERKKAPLLDKLITRLPQEPHAPVSWVRSQWRELLISFVPTVLGGFSSLFVYLSGGPRFLEVLFGKRVFDVLSEPKFKIIEFCISLLMTGFLAFSFINVSRKSIKRHQEFERQKNIIVQKEGELTVLDAQLLKLKEARGEMIQISDVFIALEHVFSLLKT